MATNRDLIKKKDNILKELDNLIKPLEDKRLEYEQAQLAALDFSDKNYFSQVKTGFEASIALIETTKSIVKKHLT